MSMDDRATLRGQIDAEIHRLRLRISTLSSQRNSLAPVSRLPTEVMSNIFHYARGAHPHQSFWPYNTKSLVSLVVSWVSREWRMIAMGYSPLWTFVDISSASGLDEFAARSHNAVLAVSIETKTPDTATPVMRVALHHIDRLQSLHCGPKVRSRWSRTVDHDEDHSLWRSPAPVLRCLKLQGFSLPDDVFNHDSPCIEAVDLWDCTFSPSLSLLSLPHLTSLNITHPAIPLSVGLFVHNLCQMIALEDLSLHRALADPADDLNPTAPVGSPTLWQLRSAVITDEAIPDAVVLLLDQIYLPPIACVNVVVDIDREADLSAGQVIRATRQARTQSYPPWRLEIIEEIGSAYLRTEELQDEGGHAADNQTRFNYPHTPRDNIHANHLLYAGENLLRTLSAITVDLSGLCDIKLTDEVNVVSKEDLVTVLGELQRLEGITVSVRIRLSVMLPTF